MSQKVYLQKRSHTIDVWLRFCRYYNSVVVTVTVRLFQFGFDDLRLFLF